jgi:hypothetical protein
MRDHIHTSVNPVNPIIGVSVSVSAAQMTIYLSNGIMLVGAEQPSQTCQLCHHEATQPHPAVLPCIMRYEKPQQFERVGGGVYRDGWVLY